MSLPKVNEFIQPKGSPTVVARTNQGDFALGTKEEFQRLGGVPEIDPSTGLFRGVRQVETFDLGSAKPFSAFEPPPQVPVDTQTPKTSATAPTLPETTAQQVGTDFVTTLTKDVEAKRKAVEDAYQKQLDSVNAEKKKAEAEIARIEKQQQNTIEQDIQPLLSPFREKLEKTERERLKIEENFFANQSLVNELNTLLTEGNEAIKRAQSASGPSSLMNRRLNQVISDVSARAGVIEAVMSARNGQIAQAQRLIDRSVQAVSADRQDQLNYYSTLLDFYQTQKDEEGKKLVDLTKEERRFVDAQISLLENDLTQTQATADYVKGLMIDPETAKFVADAGVTLNDSVDQINQKMAEHTKKLEIQQQQKTNRETALNAGVTTQFYNIGGEIGRVSDGFAFSDPQQFQQMTGLTIQEAEAKGMVTVITGSAKKGGRDTQVITANGRQVLVDKQTGEVLQDFGSAYKGGSSSDKITTAESAGKATQYLELNAGRDGKVSPETWQRALNAWLDDKHSVSEFVSRFKNYANLSYEGAENNYTGVK